jgi:hypothetical protein
MIVFIAACCIFAGLYWYKTAAGWMLTVAGIVLFIILIGGGP